MSDHIPTTEEVRAAFRKGSRLGWNSRRGRLFDRWLAEHDREVKADVYDEALQDAEVLPMLRNPYRKETE